MNNFNISSSPLFSGVEQNFLLDIQNDSKVQLLSFDKGEQLAQQGKSIEYLYLLVVGAVRTEMITKEGNLLEIEIIEAVRPLAPAFLFALNNRFPVGVVALERCEVLLFPKQMWLKTLQSNRQLLENFMLLNSNMSVFLSNKLQLISIKSLKSKLATYLLENTTPTQNSFFLRRSRTQLAEYFGVQRPSLGRSLATLVNDNLIQIKGKVVTVIDRAGLMRV